MGSVIGLYGDGGPKRSVTENSHRAWSEGLQPDYASMEESALLRGFSHGMRETEGAEGKGTGLNLEVLPGFGPDHDGRRRGRVNVALEGP